MRPIGGRQSGSNEHNPIVRGSYSHDLLIHESDRELVAGTVAFVEQGLASGGQVLVHSSKERVSLLRAALGTHPRLEYGLDSDLYLSPMTTLFGYERTVAQSQGGGDLWVTGTVPFGPDPLAHPAWTRYESLVNEVLGRYAFHALCTYDTRALPVSTIAAARATHPCLSNGESRVESPYYVDPAAFLVDPRAASPRAPSSAPTASKIIRTARDLQPARHLVARIGIEASAVSRDEIDGFVVAVNEVMENGLQHGRPPVRLSIWVDPSTLTCLVSDSGPGIRDPLAGYRHPDLDDSKGLWVARQFCDELMIRNSALGGCSVLMSAGSAR